MPLFPGCLDVGHQQVSHDGFIFSTSFLQLFLWGEKFTFGENIRRVLTPPHFHSNDQLLPNSVCIAIVQQEHCVQKSDLFDGHDLHYEDSRQVL